MQVYREIEIANDKPSATGQSLVPHHLVDLVSVTEDFNVARYRQLAVAAIQDVQARGKTPLIVGGSGMYMSVLLDGIFEGMNTNEDLREELTQELAAQGPAVLHERLKTLRPAGSGKDPS